MNLPPDLKNYRATNTLTTCDHLLRYLLAIIVTIALGLELEPFL